MAHDVVELERFVLKFAEARVQWKKKATSVIQQRNDATRRFQLAIIRIKELEEIEKKKNEEVLRLRTDLESAKDEADSARTDRDSARADFESARNDLDAARAEMAEMQTEVRALRDDAETSNWIIEVLESRVRTVEHRVNRIRQERDESASELEEEKKKRLSLEEEVASLRAERDQARLERDQAKTQALEEFRGSADFKKELLEASRLVYKVGYEDGRDAVGQMYPDLDVSQVLPPEPDEQGESSEDEPADEPPARSEAAPTDEPAAAMAVPPTPNHSPTEEEMRSAMAIIDSVAVDD